MCQYCEWMFTADEPDYLETLKEWIEGMKKNHPDFNSLKYPIFGESILKKNICKKEKTLCNGYNNDCKSFKAIPEPICCNVCYYHPVHDFWREENARPQM